MIETIIIPIIINEGSKYFYFFALLKEIEKAIKTRYVIKIHFKLLNNSKKIKYKIDYNMIKYHEDMLKFFYAKKIKYIVRKEVKREKYKCLYADIYDEIKENITMKEALKENEQWKSLGFCICENKRCQSRTSPEKLLNDIALGLVSKMQEEKEKPFAPHELKKAEELIRNLENEEDFKYENNLRRVEVICRNCKHTLNEDVIYTPKYIVDLHKKIKKSKCII